MLQRYSLSASSKNDRNIIPIFLKHLESISCITEALDLAFLLKYVQESGIEISTHLA
jgi:hypothetical protein